MCPQSLISEGKKDEYTNYMSYSIKTSEQDNFDIIGSSVQNSVRYHRKQGDKWKKSSHGPQASPHLSVDEETNYLDSILKG